MQKYFNKLSFQNESKKNLTLKRYIFIKSYISTKKKDYQSLLQSANSFNYANHFLKKSTYKQNEKLQIQLLI